MAASTTTVEGFSISHAAILDSTTGIDTVVGGDIYGVRQGSLSVDTGSFDNTGDDNILSTWAWFNFGTLSITGGYVPFSTISLLAGSTITSSGASGSEYYGLPLWNQLSLNQPTRSVLIRVPSKDNTGNVRTLDFILYRVQFDPISFDGPTYKDGLVLNYGGKALMSTIDEKGATLTQAAIGKLVSRPTTGTGNLAGGPGGYYAVL